MEDVYRSVNLGLLRRLRGMDETQIRVRNAREKSLNELKQRHRASGHGVFFCVHDKHYFVSCTACGRSKRDADKNRAKFVNKMQKHL